jgi:hypothetical protein
VVKRGKWNQFTKKKKKRRIKRTYIFAFAFDAQDGVIVGNV